MLGSACGGKLWHADFSVDPTTQDLNGDGVDDFAVRSTGGPLPGTLGNGEWIDTNGPSLDSQPKQPFTTRIVIDVTMANTTQPSSGHGTIMWINTAYTDTTFAPLFIDVQRNGTGTSQNVTVYDKSNPATEASIDGFSVGDDLLHHYHLDIDPNALTYHLVMDGGVQDRGTHTYSSIPLSGNTDQWATVQAQGGTSAFDDFQVEVCP